MAKDRAVYAPGELNTIKKRLGPVNEKDAKRMQKILGGEVGRERDSYEEEKIRKEADAAKAAAFEAQKVKHIVELPPDEDEAKKPAFRKSASRRVNKLTYSERVRMDECCGEVENGIKSPWQVFVSKISLFKAPKDKVNPYFIKVILDEYYKQIEILVTSTRLLFPRNNTARALTLKKTSPFAFSVLDTLRQWELNKISTEIAKFQRHPRDVYISEFHTILREIYKPVILLQKLAIEPYIQLAFDKLYSIIYLSNPGEAEGLRPKITAAISAFEYIRAHITVCLYPLLMKILGDYYLPREEFFTENRAKVLDFLEISEEAIIKIPAPSALEDDVENTKDGAKEEVAGEEQGGGAVEDVRESGEEKEARREKEAAAERSLDKGRHILEKLFPRSPLDGKTDGGDLFPYFAEILDLKKGTEIISPLDPSLLALVLARIVSELLFGLRSVQFNFNTNEEDYITPVLEEWQKTIDESFYNNYVPKLNEYAHMFETTRRNIKSQYSMNLLNDIQWMRRYYLFPLYDYKSGIPPSFSKKDIHSLHFISRQMRKILTDIAQDIDLAVKNGAPESGAVCFKIKNPWDAYEFQIDNPLSKRLNSLLPKKQQINVSLIFFTLAVCSVLDNHLNNHSSPAYSFDKDIVFRSVNNGGEEPVFWVEKRDDTEALFKKTIVRRKGAS
jgi:hypothetical protein